MMPPAAPSSFSQFVQFKNDTSAFFSDDDSDSYDENPEILVDELDMISARHIVIKKGSNGFVKFLL